MAEYPFAKSDEAKQLCRRVEQALITFGGKTEEEAVGLIRAYFHRQNDFDDDPLIYHEVPYYYAMCILHHPVIGDNNIEWFHDPRLWPPPEGWKLG